MLSFLSSEDVNSHNPPCLSESYAAHERMQATLEFKTQPPHPDPLADARAWLAHMEQTLVRLAAEYVPKEENECLWAGEINSAESGG
jgi:hypothetical protein